MLDACATEHAAEALGGDDPEAWWEMVQEVRAMYDGIMAALTMQPPNSG